MAPKLHREGTTQTATRDQRLLPQTLYVWNFRNSQSSSQFTEPRIGKGLREDVCQVVLCRHIGNFDLAGLLLFPNEVVPDLDMFGSFMKLIILHQLDGAVVVAQDSDWLVFVVVYLGQ